MITIVITMSTIAIVVCREPVWEIGCTPSPPTKNSGFRGFDSSRLLILRGGILMSVRKTLNRWTGRLGRGSRGPRGKSLIKGFPQ